MSGGSAVELEDYLEQLEDQLLELVCEMELVARLCSGRHLHTLNSNHHKWKCKQWMTAVPNTGVPHFLRCSQCLLLLEVPEVSCSSA